MELNSASMQLYVNQTAFDMSLFYIGRMLEPPTGIEPVTLSLPWKCSTSELRRHDSQETYGTRTSGTDQPNLTDHDRPGTTSTIDWNNQRTLLMMVMIHPERNGNPKSRSARSRKRRMYGPRCMMASNCSSYWYGMKDPNTLDPSSGAMGRRLNAMRPRLMKSELASSCTKKSCNGDAPERASRRSNTEPMEKSGDKNARRRNAMRARTRLLAGPAAAVRAISL